MVLFICQCFLSSFALYGQYIVEACIGTKYQNWIEEQGLSETAESFLQFMRYVVILQFLIPISYVVVLELVKFFQSI